MRWDLNALRVGGTLPVRWVSDVDLDLRLPPGVGTSFLGLPLATLPAWVSQGHAHGTGLLAKGSSASRNRTAPTPAHLGPVSEMGGGGKSGPGTSSILPHLAVCDATRRGFDGLVTSTGNNF